MDTLNIDTKSQLAKLIATENITVQQNNVKTASFDVVNRVLTLPIFKTESKDVTDMLVAHECAHALFTPTNGWKKIADDNELRSSLVSKGYKQSKKFDWKICALETLKVYKNLI